MSDMTAWMLGRAMPGSRQASSTRVTSGHVMAGFARAASRGAVARVQNPCRQNHPGGTLDIHKPREQCIKACHHTIHTIHTIQAMLRGGINPEAHLHSAIVLRSRGALEQRPTHAGCIVQSMLPSCVFYRTTVLRH
jgi:hypothetical protein